MATGGERGHVGLAEKCERPREAGMQRRIPRRLRQGVENHPVILFAVTTWVLNGFEELKARMSR
jgi:hypothetical protein